MTIYVGMGMIFFDGADDSDAWAQGNAQWLKDNTEVLAQQAALVSPGSAAERSSYFGAFKVQIDGTLTLISAWHLNDAGVVTQGMPGSIEVEPEPEPEIQEWTDIGSPSYIVGDLRSYSTIVYVCISAHTAWEGAGWNPPAAPNLWSVAP